MLLPLDEDFPLSTLLHEAREPHHRVGHPDDAKIRWLQIPCKGKLTPNTDHL
jgi:hypothetical protein